MRIPYLVKKELIETVRQRQMLMLIFVMPVIQIIILGYVMNTDIRHIPVEVVDLSHSAATRPIIARLTTTPQFTVKKIGNQPIDAMERLRRGDVKAVILFRDPMDRKRQKVHYPEIQILMDGIDSNTSLIAAGYFNGITRNYIIGDLGHSGRSVPVQAKSVIRFNPELRSIYYMGPCIVAMLLTVAALFITSMVLVREKEQQTMDTLLISPLKPIEMFIGKGLPVALIGMIQAVIGMVVMLTWFGIPIRGSIWELLVAILFYNAAVISYGLLISMISATQQEAMFFAWFSMINFMLLSGFLTPYENIPAWLRPLADINPLRYFVSIIREIFLKGNGIGHFWQELGALALIALVLVSISLANFRRFLAK